MHRLWTRWRDEGWEWWEWFYLIPMAFAGTGGIFIVTGSWKIWLAFFIAAIVYEVLLPLTLL